MTVCECRSFRQEEFLPLYESVGWTAYTDQPHILKEGFAHSLLILAAYENDRLLGLLRAVGDGYTVVFVQDILVYPQYQRKGVGSALLQALLRRFCHVRLIELTTDDTPQTAAFYRANGFSEMSAAGCRGFIRCPEPSD